MVDYTREVWELGWITTERCVVIGLLNILLGSVCVSTFHPRNVTICCNEGVKKRSIVGQTVRSI